MNRSISFAISLGFWSFCWFGAIVYGFSGKAVTAGVLIGMVVVAAGIGVVTGLWYKDQSIKSYALFGLPCVIVLLFFWENVKTPEGIRGLVVLGLLGVIQLVCRAITIRVANKST